MKGFIKVNAFIFLVQSVFFGRRGGGGKARSPALLTKNGIYQNCPDRDICLLLPLVLGEDFGARGSRKVLGLAGILFLLPQIKFIKRRFV